jgi:hypothetical protein
MIVRAAPIAFRTRSGEVLVPDSRTAEPGESVLIGVDASSDGRESGGY